MAACTLCGTRLTNVNRDLISGNRCAGCANGTSPHARRQKAVADAKAAARLEAEAHADRERFYAAAASRATVVDRGLGALLPRMLVGAGAYAGLMHLSAWVLPWVDHTQVSWSTRSELHDLLFRFGGFVVGLFTWIVFGVAAKHPLDQKRMLKGALGATLGFGVGYLGYLGYDAYQAGEILFDRDKHAYYLATGVGVCLLGAWGEIAFVDRELRAEIAREYDSWAAKRAEPSA